MKLNNGASVTGVFSYSDSLRFEENDFVIHNGIIYICSPKNESGEVRGEEPGTSDNFTIYLGNMASNIQEYMDFVDNGGGENKYLSTLTLQQALNQFMLGINGRGIIGSYVEKNEDTYEVVFSDSTSLVSSPTSIIGDIFEDESINHAVFRVSRSLPELVDIVGELDPLITETNNSVTNQTDLKSCILKQYTYLAEDTAHRIRVQELIDPVEGVIYYRSGDRDSGGIRGAVWKCSIVNMKLIKRKADNLFALYNGRLKVLWALGEHLKRNFRYRKLEIKNRESSVIFKEIGKILPEITVTITVGGDSVYKNYETTIFLSDTISPNVYPEYKIGDYILNISVSEEGDVTLSLKDNPPNVWFSGAFYREYYDL